MSVQHREMRMQDPAMNGGWVPTLHTVRARLSSPDAPAIAKSIYNHIEHEITRWWDTKPHHREYARKTLAEKLGCSIATITRAVAWLRTEKWLHIERTGRGNRYHLHAPPAIIEDRLPKDPRVITGDHSDGSRVITPKTDDNPDNSVPDDVSETEPPPPKEQRTKNKNLKAESKNPPSESSANVGAEGEDKKLESLTPKATSPEKSKSLTPETTTTSTSREVSEDIRSETPEDAICRLSPAAQIAFAEVMQAQSLPSGNPVRVAQAKAIRDHLDQDITAGRGVEPVTRALQKTLEGIADLRNPMLYFAAELSRQRATANTNLKGREAIRAATAPPERGLVSEAEWERTLEGLSPALAAMTRKTRKIITEREPGLEQASP